MSNITLPHLPDGFRAAGIAAHIKKNGQPDLALIVSDRDCRAAAVFTTNKVKAAPVLHDQAMLAEHADHVRAVIINSGCANACTGAQGLQDCSETARHAAESLRGAGGQRVDDSQVFVMSTGVIGVNLPMDRIRTGMTAAVESLNADGLEHAARAIMTTDTVPKIAYTEVVTDACAYRIAGIAKGSGMIHPNMATLLSVVMTDAAINSRELKEMLVRAAGQSFNRISVDGDTSTNDTLLALANGASGIAVESEESRRQFQAALTEVCIDLAKQMARDGEGATKLITLEITGAPSSHAAEIVGRTIAKSPLVKTAFYGEDANWGRIIAAAGYSGEDVDPERMSLWFGPVLVFEKGMPTKYSEEQATRAIQTRDVAVRLDLGLGDASATIWTCDLSHDYVTINGRYRT
ncbi:MAG: bifunctional glutamate N-acetyltransferase/amino-acid acetyltransferase ArgJ [Chloroflexi bacterium]|nr:bifunctional glutamate N-acetyltransferase/amino-acid acetyltransferase ArgJ [Chloroflexota bacterium]MCL5275228.1 bifunctional glutamate N-acetyltransferase/amino-acid acetyltransferase ArgJ [Chloroflexota bacterium]